MMAGELDAMTAEVSFWLAFQIHRYDHRCWEPEVGLAWCHFRESNRDALVSLARGGWRTAHVVLCDMAAILTAIGDPLPLWLQQYAVQTARAGPVQARRGQHPLNNIVRDLAIAATVRATANKYDLRPMRNPAKTIKESGCSIVKKALECLGIYMSESNVAAIWQTQTRLDRIDTRRRYELDTIRALSKQRRPSAQNVS